MNNNVSMASFSIAVAFWLGVFIAGVSFGGGVEGMAVDEVVGDALGMLASWRPLVRRGGG